MDNFMDKLAKRFNAGEIIKANSQAEARDMKRMQERTAEYERMMQEMRRLNLKNVELTEQVQQLIQCGIEQIEGYGSTEALLGNKIDETGTSLKEEIEPVKNYMYSVKYSVDSVKESTDSIKDSSDLVRESVDFIKNDMESLKGSVGFVRDNMDAVKDGTDLVKDSVDLVRTDMESVRDSVDLVRTDMESVRDSVDSVKTDIGPVRDSVDSVRADMEAVRDSVDFVRSDMTSVRDGLDFIRGNMDSVKDGTDLVKEGMDSVKADMESLKGSISDAAYKTDDGFYRVSGRLDEMERNINEEMQQNHQAVFIAIRDLEDKAGNDSEMMESIRTMKELLVGLRLNSEEGQKHLEEHVHKENVRVYRNVQAVVSEEATRRARELGERIDHLESGMKKNSGLKPLVIITLLLALASLGMQVAQILQLF